MIIITLLLVLLLLPLLFANFHKNGFSRFHEKSGEFHENGPEVKIRGASSPNEESGDDGSQPNENSGKFHKNGPNSFYEHSRIFHNNNGWSTRANETTEMRGSVLYM